MQSQDSPQDPLRFLLEKIMPILNKNIMIAKTIIVRNIVTINMGKFNLMLTVDINKIFLIFINKLDTNMKPAL